jgi:hypothetical protein
LQSTAKDIYDNRIEMILPKGKDTTERDRGSMIMLSGAVNLTPIACIHIIHRGFDILYD